MIYSCVSDVCLMCFDVLRMWLHCCVSVCLPFTYVLLCVSDVFRCCAYVRLACLLCLQCVTYDCFMYVMFYDVLRMFSVFLTLFNVLRMLCLSLCLFVDVLLDVLRMVYV